MSGPRVCSWLIPGDPGGVAEQFGQGSWDPSGTPSTRGGMQPTSLPTCSSTATFGGARLNWGAGGVFLPPTAMLSPRSPCLWGGGHGGAQLCRAHAAPRGGCSGGICSPVLSVGGSASPARGVTAEPWAGAARGASRAWMGLGARAPLPGRTSFPAVPGALWLRPPGFHLDYTFQA